MIEYRKANEHDIDTLVHMRIEFLREVNGGKLERMKERLLQENRRYFKQAISDGTFVVWLALDVGNIIATGGLTLYDVPPTMSCINGKVGYISNIYTLREYRKQGIASALLKRIMEEAKLRGCTKVVLNATDMGRPIYEKAGFVDVQNEMVYVTDENARI